MGEKGKKIVGSPLWFFMLALIFALLAIPASELDRLTVGRSIVGLSIGLHWIFWLLLILSVLCTFPLINLALYGLGTRGLLPKFLSKLYQEEFKRETLQRLARWRQILYSTGGRLVIGGIAVLILVTLLSYTGLVRAREMNSYFYELVSGPMRRATEVTRPPTVRRFALLTSDNNQKQYLQDCLKIARDLKNVGVKAVMVELRNFLGRPGNSELLRRIENTDVVVFAVPYARNFRFADSVGEIKLSKGMLTLPTHELWQNPLIARIQPEGYRTLGDDEGLLDVTLPLLRKYRNYPREVTARREGNEVLFGDYRIPVTNDGWMYVRLKPISNVSTSGFGAPGVWAVRGIQNDTLQYMVMSTRRTGALMPIDLSEFRDRFQGKIVFLSWHVYGDGPESELATMAYFSAVEDILQNKVMKKIQLGWLWLSLFCIALSALIAFLFRPLLSTFLMFAFGIAILFFGAYLYSRDILVEIIYPLLSILMAMVFFPVITLGRGERKKQAEVLEEAPE